MNAEAFINWYPFQSLKETKERKHRKKKNRKNWLVGKRNWQRGKKWLREAKYMKCRKFQELVAFSCMPTCPELFYATGVGIAFTVLLYLHFFVLFLECFLHTVMYHIFPPDTNNFPLMIIITCWHTIILFQVSKIPRKQL